MRELKLEEVKDLWKQATGHDQLYVHFPFCTTNCKYCVYRGRVEKDKNLIKEYTGNVLPSRIEHFRDVIESDNWNTLYLGGGTVNCNGDLSSIIPAMETLSSMKSSFSEKVIELHTGFKITDEDLNLLEDYGFTTVILGIQTFSKEELIRQNRVSSYTTKEEVESLIRRLHERNMNVAVDLIGFDNLEQTKEDADFLFTLSDTPDEVTIAFLYQDKDNRVDEITQWCRRLKAQYENFYEFHDNDLITPECISSFNTFRIFKPYRNNISVPFFSFIPYLNDSENFGNECVLGIGSYRNPDKHTYSVINGYIEYVEDCKDLNDPPHYYLLRDTSFWTKCRRVIDWMEEKYERCNPSRNFMLRFTNNPEVEGHGEDEKDHSIGVYASIFDKRFCTQKDINLFRELQSSDMEKIQLQSAEDCSERI